MWDDLLWDVGRGVNFCGCLSCQNRLWDNLAHGSNTTRLGADDFLMLGPGDDHSGEIIVKASKIKAST